MTIDNFKDAICDSLERYNRQVGWLMALSFVIKTQPTLCAELSYAFYVILKIEELRREMTEATQIADAVR